MTKSILMGGLAALSLTTSLAILPGANAYTHDELAGAQENLYAQLDKINRQNPRTCPQDHTPLFKGKSLKVSLFYGYEDDGDSTSDSVHARAMADVLQQGKCTSTIVMCQFKKVSQSRNMTRLQKTINGQLVTISIYSTSVTSDNKVNMSTKEREQTAQSNLVKAQFHRELVESDIVFYSGHSRYGGGFGFNSQTTLQAIVENVSRIPLQGMMKALQVRPSRLKLLGMFSCESDKYFRIPVEERNPYINMIVSHDDIAGDEGEQQSIGALNAIIGRKCDPEVQDSLRSVVEPGHKVLQYIRRPF